MLKSKRKGKEGAGKRAAAEAAENSEMSEAECPAQESLELGASTLIRGERQACPLQSHGPDLQES